MTTPIKKESDETAPSAANHPSTSHWRNWGDHPIIVTIFLVCAVLGLGFAYLNYSKPVPEGTQDSQIITKTPKELVAWRASISNDVEAMRQTKALYVGKKILLSGKPEIIVVHISGIFFTLDSVTASMNIPTVQNPIFLDKNIKGVFLCEIRDINDKDVDVINCLIQE